MAHRFVALLVLCAACSSNSPSVPAAATVTVTPAASTVSIGQSVQLAASVAAADGTLVAGAVTWSSSSAAATVTASGVATGAQAGTAVITAASGTVSGTATVTVTQEVAVTPSLTCAPSTTSVLQHHANSCRDGRFQSAGLTRAAAAGLQPDATFNAALAGQDFYAQPLYFPGGPGGKNLLIVASEQNRVTALDAADGSTVWQTPLGTPVPLARLPCGNIDPLGVTGTPVIDEASRTIFVDAMTTPDSGTTKEHLVFALSVDDGTVKTGWPVDVTAKAKFGQLGFDSSVQNQRGALAFAGGTVYVPYGGHAGDCGAYHGWVVAIPAASPQTPSAWATQAQGGGIWGPGGVASDGTSVFASTGNTFTAGSGVYGNGEALLRFSSGAIPADSYAPANWLALDNADADLSGSGVILLDLPGSTPASLAVALGKDGNVYLMDRNSLGGLGGPAVVTKISTGAIINAAAAYSTSLGTYVVFRGSGAGCPAGQSGDLTALKINPGGPPTVSTAWCAQQNGSGSPIVTTTDGSAESIVWSLGAGSDQKLHGFNGDTGAAIYSSAALGTVKSFTSPIAAGGRIFVATSGAIRAFALPK
jgi:hypothetical protein